MTTVLKKLPLGAPVNNFVLSPEFLLFSSHTNTDNFPSTYHKMVSQMMTSREKLKLRELPSVDISKPTEMNLTNALFFWRISNIDPTVVHLWLVMFEPAPGLLPGKFHGWRSLVGYNPRGCRVGHDWAHFMFEPPRHFVLRVKDEWEPPLV